MTEAPEWKDMADWSGLPDVYVTRAKCSQEMFWRIEACSVPMAIGPEVRLICAAKHDRIVAEKDAEIARLHDKLFVAWTVIETLRARLETARNDALDAAEIRALKESPDA